MFLREVKMADLATAMREIQSVMAQPPTPVAVVILRPDGSSEEQTIDQRKLCDVLGGPPTVVGAIRALDVQAVAKRNAKGSKNKHALPENWEESVCGTIILFRTDEEAQPKPFQLTEFKAWVAEGTGPSHTQTSAVPCESVSTLPHASHKRGMET